MTGPGQIARPSQSETGNGEILLRSRWLLPILYIKTVAESISSQIFQRRALLSFLGFHPFPTQSSSKFSRVSSVYDMAALRPSPSTGQRPDWSTAAIKDVGGRPWKRRCIRRSASSTPTETTSDEMASTGAEYYMPHGLILAESMDKPQINPPVQEFLFSTRSHTEYYMPHGLILAEFLFSTRSHTEAFWEFYSDSEFEFQYYAGNYPGSEAITLVADDRKP